jgi:hypothetical protein
MSRLSGCVTVGVAMVRSLDMFRPKLGDINHGRICDQLLQHHGDGMHDSDGDNEPICLATYISAAASDCSFQAQS